MESKIVGNIVLPDKIIYGGSVVFENGIITQIEESTVATSKNLPYILPGLVDIHNHGAMGHDYMEATKDAFCQISGHLLRHGVTTSQATSSTAPVSIFSLTVSSSRFETVPFTEITVSRLMSETKLSS